MAKGIKKIYDIFYLDFFYFNSFVHHPENDLVGILLKIIFQNIFKKLN